MSSAVALMRLAPRRARPPKRLPSTVAPRHLDRSYLRELLSLMRPAWTLVEEHLIPQLDAILREAKPQFIGDSLVTDDFVDRVGFTIDGIRADFARQSTPEEFAQIVRRAGWRTVDVNRLRTARQLQVLTGLDLVKGDPGLGPIMRAFVRENVSLIGSIQSRYFTEVETLVLRNARAGMRADSLARALRERFDITESKAAGLARDQTNKFNGALTEARHTALGITGYVWRTGQDDFVRPDHEALDGTLHRYAKPPIVDRRTGRRANPGGDFNCRCTGEPHIPGFNDPE